MLKARLNIDVKDNKGWTPLHYAVSQGQNEVALVLLKQGADRTIISRDGFTPKLLAQRQCNTEILELLNYVPLIHREPAEGMATLQKPMVPKQFEVCQYFKALIWSSESEGRLVEQRVGDLLFTPQYVGLDILRARDPSVNTESKPSSRQGDKYGSERENNNLAEKWSDSDSANKSERYSVRGRSFAERRVTSHDTPIRRSFSVERTRAPEGNSTGLRTTSPLPSPSPVRRRHSGVGNDLWSGGSISESRSDYSGGRRISRRRPRYRLLGPWAASEQSAETTASVSKPVQRWIHLPANNVRS
jgi:hypothetical protein